MNYKDTPLMLVKCGVDNCHFNNSHICRAEDIEVNVTGNGKAETCAGTCCTTFVNNRQNG